MDGNFMDFQLLYRSVSNHSKWHSSDMDILNHAIAANKLAGISGYLLRDQRLFYQVLEGSEDRLRLLFARICRDQRHTDVECLKFEAVDKPLFADWSMGYQVARLSGLAPGGISQSPHGPEGDADAIIAQIKRIASH